MYFRILPDPVSVAARRVLPLACRASHWTEHASPSGRPSTDDDGGDDGDDGDYDDDDDDVVVAVVDDDDDGDDDDDDDGDGDDDGDVQGRKSTSNGTFQILNQKPNFIGGWMKICKILFCQKFH